VADDFDNSGAASLRAVFSTMVVAVAALLDLTPELNHLYFTMKEAYQPMRFHDFVLTQYKDIAASQSR
jgi:hypothetical protein